jgi:hypothetical protein
MSSLDRSKLRTCGLADRRSKVHVSGFARPYEVGDSFRVFLEKLPDFLGVRDIRHVATAVVNARTQGKTVLVGLGAHVIKVGLVPIIIDLFEAGWLSGLATNGAGMIHDFEIALAGHTSEDVDATLDSGDFGMAEETGRILNRMIRTGVQLGDGLGRAVGKGLIEIGAPFGDRSLLVAAAREDAPMTVHVAIGTDINHLHVDADGAAIGEGSYRDFLEFCERVAALEGGVYVNLGSAVILPEVFLKALSLARNLGRPLRDITTVNMDFLQHYRPLTNVVRRPTAQGGQGFSLIGHHELLVPVLAAMIKEEGARLGFAPANSRFGTRVAGERGGYLDKEGQSA